MRQESGRERHVAFEGDVFRPYKQRHRGLAWSANGRYREYGSYSHQNSACSTYATPLPLHLFPVLSQILALKEWRLGLFPGGAMLPFGQLKTLAHVGRLMIHNWATEHGFDDVLCTTEKGVLLETGLANLVWRSKSDAQKRLFTPSRQLLIYFGSSTDCLLDAAREIGAQPTEGFFALSDIPADANIYRINSFEVRAWTHSLCFILRVFTLLCLTTHNHCSLALFVR